MKNFYKKNHKIIKLFIFCFIIGFIIAYLFYHKIDKKDLNIIINNIKTNNILFNIENNSINHLKILSLIILFSLIFIGFPIFIGLLIGEGFNISLNFILFNKIYQFKGIIYILYYSFLNCFIYILILLILFKRIINITKALYKYKFKGESLNSSYIYTNLVKCIYLIIINLIIDYLLYLYGYNILRFIKRLCRI